MAGEPSPKSKAFGQFRQVFLIGPLVLSSKHEILGILQLLIDATTEAAIKRLLD